jgi:hypothetical protein
VHARLWGWSIRATRPISRTARWPPEQSLGGKPTGATLDSRRPTDRPDQARSAGRIKAIRLTAENSARSRDRLLPRSQDWRAKRTWTRGPSGPGAKRTGSRAQMVPAAARPYGTASRRTNVGAKRVRTDRAARASQRTGQPGRSRRGFAKADATARSAAPALCATARTRTKGFVLLFHAYHREQHRAGTEVEWWSRLGIERLQAARTL